MPDNTFRDIDQQLISGLSALGAEYGALGVALAAAMLTDPAIVVERLAQKPCTRCDGCGRLADTVAGEPWSVWLDLPLKSSLAVLAGLVHPVPCPACDGTGRSLMQHPAPLDDERERTTP